MVFFPARLGPEVSHSGTSSMASRAVRHRLPTRERNPSGPVVYRPAIQQQSKQRVSYTLSGLSLDSPLRDLHGSGAQTTLSPGTSIPVISFPGDQSASNAAGSASSAAAGASHSTSKQRASDARTTSSSSTTSSHALPEELLQLADATAPVVLPAPGSVPAGSLDNRELDKLVGTLGRNKATWRRALVLSQWLQDSGHVLDDRLCTTLIRVCSEHGQAMTALSVYEWMKAPGSVGGAGLSPTVYTYTAAMRAALAAGLLDRALAVWEDAQAVECPLDCRLCITYIEVCSRKGLAERALAMYDAMRAAPKGSKLAPTVHAYTAAMRAATEGGAWQKALDIWQDMTAAGVLPTGHAFAAAMSACAAGSNWQQAVALFEDMCRAGIKPDVVSCTALISALAAAGQWQRGESVVQWMLSTGGVRPNVRTYTALLTALGNARQWERAEEMLSLMQQPSWGGVAPNAYTYSALLKCLGECGEWQRAEALFALLERQTLAATAAHSSGMPWEAAAAAVAAGASSSRGYAAGGFDGLGGGMDAEVAPGVWGWQAASSRQGLIQRPGQFDGSSSSSSHADRQGNSSRSNVEAASSSSQLWTSASQLHGLDLELQHEAAAGISSSSANSSSNNLAGSERCDSPALEAAAPSSSNSYEGDVTAAAAAAVSSNMLAQQLAQMALQQQLVANVDLQALLMQQQQYHQQHALQPQQPQQVSAAVMAAQHQLQQQQQQVRQRQQLLRSVHSVSPNGHSARATAGSSSSSSSGSSHSIINEGVLSALMMAYERGGKWREAVGVLARAASLGVAPGPGMFGAAICAAGRAGQLALADALFVQARGAGAADASTYESMIGVLGMAGDPPRAELVFRAMQAAGHVPGEYAYCGLIAAHSLAGDAVSAMRVRQRLAAAGCSAGVHVYNALIAAADRAGLYDKALELLRSMRRDGAAPDALTQQLAADIGRKGAATVEGQQITAAALSAAMAAAGTLLIRSGVF